MKKIKIEDRSFLPQNYSGIVEYPNGEKVWYKDGLVHSYNNKPAVIGIFGTRYWFENGEIHRGNDKPAIVYINGRRAWYKHGLRHRGNKKPALINATALPDEYWINGNKVSRMAAEAYAILFPEEQE